MYKTLSYDIIRFLLTQHTFVIAIHTFAFFAVLAMITFVFISDAYSIVGASLITATICIFAVATGGSRFACVQNHACANRVSLTS